MKQFLVFIFFAFFLSLSACNVPQSEATPTSDADVLATMVEATLAAFPTSTPAPVLPTATNTPIALPSPVATATPQSNSVSGKVCYPADVAGDATLYFQDTTSNVVTQQSLAGRPANYSATLSPGTYIGYYWINDFSFGATYTGCTSQADCPSDKPKQFTVVAGQPLSAIDFCDLTHGPFDIPYPPGQEPQQTTGSINGSISYPYGSIPALTVVAFNQTTGYWYYVQTGAGQAYYSLDNLLPPGQYQVVAYDGSHAGGSPVVTVEAGKSAVANITDWAGSYPANPLK